MPWVYWNVLESKQGLLQGLSWSRTVHSIGGGIEDSSSSLCKSLQSWGPALWAKTFPTWQGDLVELTVPWYRDTGLAQMISDYPSPPHWSHSLHLLLLLLYRQIFQQSKGSESLSHCLDSYLHWGMLVSRRGAEGEEQREYRTGVNSPHLKCNNLLSYLKGMILTPHGSQSLEASLHVASY